jgi:tRNA-dihydrouridine synthase
VKKVIKAGAGAILMKDPGLSARIIKAVKKALKFRLLQRFAPVESFINQRCRNSAHCREFGS